MPNIVLLRIFVRLSWKILLMYLTTLYSVVIIVYNTVVKSVLAWVTWWYMVFLVAVTNVNIHIISAITHWCHAFLLARGYFYGNCKIS